MSNLPSVVVAMSGGVDSSVAAALLVEKGYPVIGIMMRLWSEPGKECENQCCTPEALSEARRVAAKLGIPFYVIDASDIFYEKIVKKFVHDYTHGLTPNPCVLCNRTIRWGFLQERARALGAEYMVTGHYARIETDDSGRYYLKRSFDETKDQSYVLCYLTQEDLAHTMLPLGKYRKSEVREMAQSMGLSVASRADSQDLCFIGNGDYRSFIRKYAAGDISSGKIVNLAGDELGEHNGLAFYTIGQRKGIGIAAPEPYYVVDKDGVNNRLIVGTLGELGRCQLQAKDINWIAGEPPHTKINATVKIRYKAADVSAEVTPLDESRALVKFKAPLRDITPGQVVVFYDGDIVLGGGVISSYGD